MSSPLTIYKASAGSGKTFTLTVQYIKLLVSQASSPTAYRNILAVTFTNKATTEMKDRILQQLYGLWKKIPSSDGYLKALQKEFEADNLFVSEEDIRERAGAALKNILHDYNHFRVETIDSFFQSVLKNLAHELNLTANLQVDLNDKQMLKLAVNHIMERLHADPRTLNWILEYIHEKIQDDERWDITREVENFASSIFTPDYLNNNKELHAILGDEKRIKALRAVLKDLRDGALDALNSAREHFEEVIEEKNINCNDFSNGKTLSTFLKNIKEKGFNVKVSDRINKYAEDWVNLLQKAKQKDSYWITLAQEVSKLVAELLDIRSRMMVLYNTSNIAIKFLNPLRLLGIIDKEVTEISSESNRFLLARTPILLSELIEDSDAPFIFEKMGVDFHHVMIDEFQDTSTLQWRNFKTLLLENLSSKEYSKNLLVGDVKQSIYRWRNGDWTILHGIEEEMSTHQPIVKTLSHNYRSEPRIISFNNQFFTNAAKNLDNIQPEARIKIEDAYKDVHQVCPKADSESGYVRFVIFPKKTPQEVLKESEEAYEEFKAMRLHDLCNQVVELNHSGVDYKEMAILIRTHKYAEPIIATFAQYLPDVKIISDEAFLLSSSIGINILVAALRYLDDIEDEVSLKYIIKQYHQKVLKQDLNFNTLMTIKAEEALPDEFLLSRDELKLMPLYELNEALFKIFSLDRLKEEDSFFFSYFDEVTTYLKDNPSDLHSFTKYWDETLSHKSIPSGEIDGIRLLTIHKSKGLQYHTILVPFADWYIEKNISNTYKNARDLLWCTPTTEPYNELPTLPAFPDKYMKDSVFRAEYEEEHLQRRVDSINMLYVALTRAEKNLLVWCEAKEGLSENSSISDLILSSLPSEFGEMKVDENGIHTYTYGTPYIKYNRQSKEENNRMTQASQPIVVEMKTHSCNIEFRQSTKSELFIKHAGMDETSESLQKEETQQTYIKQGKLLHYIFSTIHTADDLDKVMRRLETDGIMNGNIQKEQIQKWVSKGFTNPTITNWFSGKYQLYNECEILSLDKNTGTFIKRRPDRVMMNNSEIIVTDFKFGTPRPEYHEQVREYMKLLREMNPDKQVKGYLWYVYINKVEEIKVTKE